MVPTFIKPRPVQSTAASAPPALSACTGNAAQSPDALAARSSAGKVRNDEQGGNDPNNEQAHTDLHRKQARNDARKNRSGKKLHADPNSKVSHDKQSGLTATFERFSAAGSPAAFCLALSLVVIWAVSGPIFGFSETWQLVINTGTTIVTFLMVFLIQKSQNKDSHKPCT